MNNWRSKRLRPTLYRTLVIKMEIWLLLRACFENVQVITKTLVEWLNEQQQLRPSVAPTGLQQQGSSRFYLLKISRKKLVDRAISTGGQ